MLKFLKTLKCQILNSFGMIFNSRGDWDHKREEVEKDDWIKSVRTKKGVTLKYLKPEIKYALKICLSAYEKKGFTLTVTSTRDGKHMHGSKHYTDEAFDTRIWGMNKKIRQEIISECKMILGPNYDIIDEGDHLHFEYDIKT